jgi:hypothetical protein
MRIRLTGERGYQDSVIDWDGDFSTTILLFYPQTLESSEYDFQRIDVDGIPVYVWSGWETHSQGSTSYCDKLSGSG